ncbi:MAG: tRNA guanosine(34) transglycosylase Tgt [bacterium]|nr:tRNA guanosine(34) transglycosylase Tgt [bacterium]MCP4967903.1 tRNA guanosine(34) transglycosylase Tgt [bacterium]
MSVTWGKTAGDGKARSGVLRTSHGEVATPAFMPVGTRGTVKTVDAEDLERVGAEMVLANTYHLMLRPTAETVAALGELHGFMSWAGPILTDSGGYQVFSLNPTISEDGVVFRSTYDGARVELTPEHAVAVQEMLGSDVAMILDVLIGLPATREDTIAAMDRTLRWAERAVAAKTRGDRALWGIVQGGSDPELRARSAAGTAALGFPGFGIGGLSVGEEPAARNAAVSAVVAELPESAPRYVMGLGDTEGILDCVARGADLFDCVLPTRLARHGKVLTRTGDFSIKRAEWIDDDTPIEDDCTCVACRRYSRGYVRHLFATKEFLGPRLLSVHNLAYTLDLMSRIREAIAESRYSDFRRETIAARRTG